MRGHKRGEVEVGGGGGVGVGGGGDDGRWTCSIEKILKPDMEQTLHFKFTKKRNLKKRCFEMTAKHRAQYLRFSLSCRGFDSWHILGNSSLLLSRFINNVGLR